MRFDAEQEQKVGRAIRMAEMCTRDALFGVDCAEIILRARPNREERTRAGAVDRLEQAVREPERQDVLGWFFAEEVIDSKDLVLVERFVQLRVERDSAVTIGPERLLHDDPRIFDEVRSTEHFDHCQRGFRRYR